MDLRTYLQVKLREIISEWKEDDIYAISFLISANPTNRYKGYSNVTEFSVSYNTENDCIGKGGLAEERWNYAFWRQNEVPVIQADDEDDGMRLLVAWYEENGIENIGYEDPGSCYGDNMQYIGKGPVGCFELLMEAAAVAKELQESGFVRDKIGKPVPIIVHELEYPWYVFEATKIANPNNEANIFFSSMKKQGLISDVGIISESGFSLNSNQKP